MTSEKETTEFHAQAFFLHYRHLTQYIPELELQAFEDWANRHQTKMQVDGLRHGKAERIVTGIYQNRPTELAVWLMEDRKIGDSQLVTTSQQFYFRKFSETRKAFRARFSFDNNVEIEGRFSTSRCVGHTGLDLLSGSRRVTILGHAQIIETKPKLKIEITPLFIGQIVERPSSERSPIFDFTDARREVWPSEIDQFNKIKDARQPTAAMRREVSGMPEAQVKEYFAKIIGEPYVGKDWGGETSDLYSSRLTIDGRPVSVAFAFKGPGKKGRLTVAGMGKNGDQALRLFEEPIDIGVVQHHTEIVSAVRNLLEAVSRHRGARFMVIDGNMTAQILGAYGYLSSQPKLAEAIPADDGEF